MFSNILHSREARMKLGKLPARINSTQLKLGTYFDHTEIAPHIPVEFGPDDQGSWGVNGNDLYQSCVWAGAARETEIWARETGLTVTIDAEQSLADYALVTGFDPADPKTDVGTDVQVAASYRRRIGLLDADGARHKIGGYVSLIPGEPDQLAAATYIFGAVGVGLRIPDYAMDEFDAGTPWAVRYGVPKMLGCQYVPAIGRAANGNIRVITWGRVHEMMPSFYRRYCDEAVCYFSQEFLRAGVAPPGFDRAKLLADLEAFTRR
jgi:hypothetical protein